MDVAVLADFLREKGKNRFPDPEGVAKCIQKAARSSYRLSKCVEDSVDVLLATSIECIRTLSAQIKQLDKAIERLLDGIPNTLQTLPGIGPVFCSGILAEIGDINRLRIKLLLQSMPVLHGVNTSPGSSKQKKLK